MNEARDSFAKVLEAGDKILGKRDSSATLRGNSPVSKDKSKRQKRDSDKGSQE